MRTKGGGPCAAREWAWAALIVVAVFAFGPAHGSTTPPLDKPSAPDSKTPSPDERARRLVAAMTLDQKIGLLHTQFGVPLTERPQPKGALGSAGFNPGIAVLGIPPLEETDAGLGVANPTNADTDSTAMPSTLAIGAAFDPDLARAAGAAIGAEARAKGFSVMLAGGTNLIREPRGGRNFEYVSEDPLLTGTMVGAEVAGIQSQRIVSTVKHFSLNSQENGRIVLDARLAESAFRESDLLAFELAIERGAPGAVMAAYNRVNGAYASENAHLLTDVLKNDWHYPGWVMADWGGTHSTERAVLAGLDQESGEEDDLDVYFAGPLKSAVAAGRVPMARIDEMVLRILRAQIVAGVFDDPPKPDASIDFAAHALVARKAATRGIVLLKNEHDVLPLSPDLKHVLVVGGQADIGVLSGGGSSQVAPRGSIRFEGVPAKLFYGKPRLVDPSPPLTALRAALPGTRIDFDDGQDPAAAARRARNADVVVVFASRWSNESLDLDGLSLPFEQDKLIAAIAAANPRTAVVLETPGGVTMPWLAAVPALVEAWYPGERGGEAIADILTGRANPSGRLPISFPASEAELPRPAIPTRGRAASYPKEALKTEPFQISYDVEGADVGYKWYLRTARKPLFPFGFGLSYTRFETSRAQVAVGTGDAVTVSFDVANTGPRAGLHTAEVYMDVDGMTRRLVGWAQAEMKPGETRRLAVTVDPRLLARFDVTAHAWHIAAGRYTFAVRPDSMQDGPSVEAALAERLIPATHGPCAAGSAVVCVGGR